jgi:hypothetical protein
MMKPFRITIEHWDEKVVLERESSDVDIHQLQDLLIRACHAMGFHQSSIDEIFRTDD